MLTAAGNGQGKDPQVRQEWFEQAPYAGTAIESDSLVNIAGRAAESLNGLWNYVLDPYDRFFDNQWWASGSDREARQGWRRPRDYDLAEAATIRVPSTINTELERCFYYEGTVVYTRTFAYRPRREGERAFLYFHGAGNRAGVALNDRWLGMHRGASTPFCVEITRALAAGDADENRLMVAVDLRRGAEQVPEPVTDWFNYGGLYRDVELIRTPPAFLKDWFVRLAPGGDFQQITIDVEVDGHTGDRPAVAHIDELGVTQRIPLDADGRGSATVFARPTLWSPEQPRLYAVRLTYGDDVVTDEIGFREIRVDGHDIRLNGERIWLKGISTHEESVSNGRTLTPQETEQNFALAEDLGCNFMRLAHYPHHAQAARLADRKGMLLWEEIPVYWRINFADEDTYADAENQLRELIRRDRNRASVVVWSVGNENPDTDDRLRFMGRLAAVAREMDPTRLVSAACVTQDYRFRDRLIDHLDVIGFNQYFGWYTPPETIERVRDLEADGLPPKPVIITETGAAAAAGHHGPAEELWTEEYQRWVYARQTEQIAALKSVRGLTPWILYDFRSPRRQNIHQRGYNLKGLLSADKTHRKLAFFTLQAFYRNLPPEA